MRRLACLLALAFASACLMAPAAGAGEYWVSACADPGMTGANLLFAPSSQGGAQARGCTAGEGLHTEVWPPSRFPPEGASFELCAPVDTVVSGVDITAETGWWGAGYARQIDGGRCGGYEPIDGGVLPTTFAGTHEAGRRVYRQDMAIGGIRVGTYCAASPCGSSSVWANWGSPAVRIRDDTLPVIGDRGGLWGASWVRGTQDVVFSASDNTGIRRLYADVDERAAGWRDKYGNCPGNARGHYARLVPCDSSLAVAPGEWTWDTRQLADGPHVVELFAEDGGLNHVWANKHRFGVDNALPVAALERPAASYGARVRWGVTDAHSGVDPASLRAEYATAGSPWQAFDGTLADGVYTATLPADAADGDVRVRLSGADLAQPGGNRFATGERVVRVDRGAPSLRLLGAGGPTAVHPGPVDVTLIADDAVSGMGHVAYKLDGGDWVRVEGDEAAVRIGGAGAHVLAYQAVDAVGNRSPEQTRTITIRPGDSRSVLDVAGFGDWTANPRTTFTAAPRFGPACPAQATLVATRDAGSGGRDTLLGFALPAAPDCVVASARLRLYAPPAAAGSRVDVARASAAWSEAAVDTDSWPGLVGAVANATVPDGGGWAEWDVAAQVQALYRHGDNGLQARAGAPVAWCTREANTAGCGADRRPELVLRFAE